MRSEQVGPALRSAREARGLTQAALGETMRGQGFPWSQATVWSLEVGTRNLLYVEAVALRAVIGFDLSGTQNVAEFRAQVLLDRIRGLLDEEAP